MSNGTITNNCMPYLKTSYDDHCSIINLLSNNRTFSLWLQWKHICRGVQIVQTFLINYYLYILLRKQSWNQMAPRKIWRHQILPRFFRVASSISYVSYITYSYISYIVYRIANCRWYHIFSWQRQIYCMPIHNGLSSYGVTSSSIQIRWKRKVIRYDTPHI